MPSGIASIRNDSPSIPPFAPRVTFAFVRPAVYVVCFPVLVLLGKAPAAVLWTWLVARPPLPHHLRHRRAERFWTRHPHRYASIGG